MFIRFVIDIIIIITLQLFIIHNIRRLVRLVLGGQLTLPSSYLTLAAGHPSIHLSMFTFTHLPIYLPVYLSFYLSIYLTMYLSISIFLILSMNFISICLFINLSNLSTLYLSFFLCFYPTTFLLSGTRPSPTVQLE